MGILFMSAFAALMIAPSERQLLASVIVKNAGDAPLCEMVSLADKVVSRTRDIPESVADAVYALSAEGEIEMPEKISAAQTSTKQYRMALDAVDAACTGAKGATPQKQKTLPSK